MNQNEPKRTFTNPNPGVKLQSENEWKQESAEKSVLSLLYRRKEMIPLV